MARKVEPRKASEYDVQIERLWTWLKEDGAVRDGTDRFSQTGAIIAAVSDPNDRDACRRYAVAQVFHHLHYVSLERAGLADCRRFRFEAAKEAEQITRLASSVRGRLDEFCEWARDNGKDTPRPVRHWPSSVAALLSARKAALIAATLIFEDYKLAVERIDNHLVDGDSSTAIQKNLDLAVERLRAGGFRHHEIGAFLDSTPAEKRTLTDRWGKRALRTQKQKPDNSGPPVMSDLVSSQKRENRSHAARQKEPVAKRKRTRTPH